MAFYFVMSLGIKMLLKIYKKRPTYWYENFMKQLQTQGLLQSLKFYVKTKAEPKVKFQVSGRQVLKSLIELFMYICIYLFKLKLED